MLKVDNITKYYDDFCAVDHLSFDVKPGEIFGLLGVNGAGKTTTFRMIIGLLKPDSGKVTLNGKPIDYDVTDDIGFLTEERSLFIKMTVKEQILYFGNLKSLDNETILKRLDYWLKKLDIEEYKDLQIKNLSKGNQQKVQFIASVIHEPKLLVLDEPFTGLDPFNVSILMEALKDMASRGTMVIFSSHRMEHVEMFCEKLLVLVRGKNILSGSLKEIKESFLKKSIHIKGDINTSKIKKIKGVEDIVKTPEEIIVKVESMKIVDDVFRCIRDSKNITRFVVEDPSLHEIFISKVGESLEE